MPRHHVGPRVHPRPRPRGPPASLAARAATAIIPIVTTAASDPVRTGLVQSVARPGGNVTGFDPFASLLNAKRIELIKETVPADQ